MANVKDCPGFETFGEDVRAGREAQGLVRKTLAEMVNMVIPLAQLKKGLE